MNVADLNQKIKASVEVLIKETDEAKQSEMFKNWLLTMSRFHRYSIGNQILIWMACPDATHVAGFHRWLKLKRAVKKGAKGIPIFAPMSVKLKQKDEETGEEIVLAGSTTRFKVVYVFDVSQTEGEPIAELEWLPVGGDNGLVAKLEALAEELGIRVGYRKLYESKGYSAGGKVVVDEALDLAGRAAVLVHEIAHELAHQHGKASKFNLTREQKEAEAEATAFVVCEHFGIEAKSGFYLASWGISTEMLMLCLNTVSTLAKQIIQGVEGDENKLPREEAA